MLGVLNGMLLLSTVIFNKKTAETISVVFPFVCYNSDIDERGKKSSIPSNLSIRTRYLCD